MPAAPSCTDVGLTLIPACASLLRFFKFSLNFCLPVHKNELYLRVIIIKTLSVVMRITTSATERHQEREMKRLYMRIMAAMSVVGLAIIACSSFSPNVNATATPVPTLTPSSQDQGGEQVREGTKIVSGSVTYTNAFFTAGGRRAGDHP